MTDLSQADWRKSSRSGGGNNCVEIMQVADVVAVRDSKNPGGGSLAFSTAVWSGFVDRVKKGGYAS